MSEAPSPRRRPGRPSRLSRELIVERALELAERHGAEVLTLRRLGQELGAAPTAIYRHFAGKDELLMAIATHLMDAAAANVPDGLPWRENMLVNARAAVAEFVRYPSVGAVMGDATYRRGAAGMSDIERGLVVMRQAGLEGREAILCFRLYVDFLIGYGAYQAQLVLGYRRHPFDQQVWEAKVAALDGSRYPHARELAAGITRITAPEVLEAWVAMFIREVEARTA